MRNVFVCAVLASFICVNQASAGFWHRACCDNTPKACACVKAVKAVKVCEAPKACVKVCAPAACAPVAACTPAATCEKKVCWVHRPWVKWHKCCCCCK